MHAHSKFYFFVSCLVGCSQTTSFSFVSNPTCFFSFPYSLLYSLTINLTNNKNNTDFLELHSICLRTRIRADFFPFCIRSGKTSFTFFFPPLCRTHTPYTNQNKQNQQEQTPSDLGQESSERSHQETYRQRHSVQRSRGYRNERQHYVHYMSRRQEEDSRNQASISCDDHQKHEKVFHLRSHGTRR